MGADGVSLKADDVFCDVIQEFDYQLKVFQSIMKATEHINKKFSEELLGENGDAANVRLALADRQWAYGDLDLNLLAAIEDDFRSGRSLEDWLEDKKALKKRKEVIETFILKLKSFNQKAKKIPKLKIQKPPFNAGDCLSVKLKNGQYGAAFVIRENHDDLENGMNLISILNYCEPEPPSLNIFSARKWLFSESHPFIRQIHWYSNDTGFKAQRAQFGLVGNIAVLESDFRKSNQHSPIQFGDWDNICGIVGTVEHSLNFKVSCRYVSRINPILGNVTSLPSAIRCSFPDSEFVIFHLNGKSLKLFYTKDVALMINDILTLLVQLKRNPSGSVSISWALEGFPFIWDCTWTSRAIDIISTSYDSNFQGFDFKTTLPTHMFFMEFHGLIAVIFHALGLSGLNMNSLEESSALNEII